MQGIQFIIYFMKNLIHKKEMSDVKIGLACCKLLFNTSVQYLTQFRQFRAIPRFYAEFHLKIFH